MRIGSEMSRFQDRLSGQAAVIRFISLLCLGSAAASTYKVIDENDLAAQIVLATGPNTTTLVLPSTLMFTKALPAVLGPLKLISVSGGSVLRCTTPTFTALTVNASSFEMSGLAWVRCGTVLVVATTDQNGHMGMHSSNVDANITIDNCSFIGNRGDLTKVRQMLCSETNQTAGKIETCMYTLVLEIQIMLSAERYDHGNFYSNASVLFTRTLNINWSEN